MRKIILLGWAPATGKSTLAKNLAKKYNCLYISWDFIRNWLQSTLKDDVKNNLFIFKGTAKQHYEKYSVEETVTMEYKRDTEVWKWIMDFMCYNKDWDFYIIEWISIHPEFLQNFNVQDVQIIPLFLVDQNDERIRYVLETRGLWWKDPDTREVEGEYLRMTNKYYLESAQKLWKKYFILDKNRDKTLQEIEVYLDNILKK